MFDVALSFISRTLHHSSLSFFLHCLSFAVHVSPVLKDRPQLVVVTSVQDVKICRPFMQHNIGMSWEWREPMHVPSKPTCMDEANRLRKL